MVMNQIRTGDIIDQLAGLGVSPTKGMGQNFLIDERVAERQIDFAEIGDEDTVLEVGPGLGAVTQALLAAAARVTAVEKDHRLAAWLRETLGTEPRFTLIESDMLEVPLDALLADPATGRPRFDACVSNLPYSSGTRILLELCRHPLCPGTLVVTVQREVAERLAAAAGEPARGQAGVWVQQDFDVALLRTIKPACFWPRPEVASTLLRLVRHRREPLKPAERRLFDELTRHAFMHRRKQMVALLRLAPPALGLVPDAIGPLLAQADVDPASRAETLSNAQWTALARALATAPTEES